MSSLHPARRTTEGATPTRGPRSSPKAHRSASRPAEGSVSATALVKAHIEASYPSLAQREGTSRARHAAGAAVPLGVRARGARTATAALARTATVTAARTVTATAKAAGRATATVRAPKAVTGGAAAPARPVAPAETAAPEAVAPDARVSTPVVAARVETPSAAVQAPVVAGAALPGDDADIPSPLRRSGPSVPRRPALYLAAALVAGLGVSAASASQSAAVAETAAESRSVSVADALGVAAEESEPIVDAETTDRLGELVASRAERDEERVHAARQQADADEKAREDAARAAAAAAEAARPEAVLPVSGARLTSGFGARWGTLHAGIDLAAPMRTPEYAAMDGVVLEAGPASGFGLAVYIQHKNGDVTVYGHMDEIRVSAGQVVKAGDTIALLGNRGQSTGPHLHFEVHRDGLDGTKIDPVPWLRDRGVRI